ncbi:NAD(P)H:quinone oxidoreductase [Rheinheimera sp.]|uniref:NAD(P)H:quinone oxidoreductase n=1 Tax=Rheinheimera sp. TaxID=1869214 RepID=UPI00307D8F09
MTKILVLYYSRHGSVAQLAEQIALGVAQAGAEALLRALPATDGSQSTVHPLFQPDELLQADGFAFGSPVRFGLMAAPLKQFWDSTGSEWIKGSLINKPAAVFSSSGSLHGGNEATLLGMMLPLLHHGMFPVGLPYSEPALHQTQAGGSPYGASQVTGLSGDRALGKEANQLAVALGKRLATMAQILKQAGTQLP